MPHCGELGGRGYLLPQDGEPGEKEERDRKFNNGRLPKEGGTPVKNDDGKKSQKSTTHASGGDKSMLGTEAVDYRLHGNQPCRPTWRRAANRSGLCAEAAMTVNILEF
ncbi:uncharacterized protein LOC124141797 [Haliotis rufescens]|uniref:uncharacterized protein LOC124141797 n=1 Tax=Haliotis rufescens TaxID=6454 RepID=UPI001EAFE3FE|nr:uncharacterized protein LOC124141797 [Haliotis rufescens]